MQNYNFIWSPFHAYSQVQEINLSIKICLVSGLTQLLFMWFFWPSHERLPNFPSKSHVSARYLSKFSCLCFNICEFLKFSIILGSGAFHGGMQVYPPLYWNGSSFPPLTPYANMYNNPLMMPYNPSMVPVSPFAVHPPYISSVGGIRPGPGYV